MCRGWTSCMCVSGEWQQQQQQFRSWPQVMERIVATCVLLTLCVGCLQVVAFKSQLLTRVGRSPSSTGAPVSYQTLYFEQKVSVKIWFHFILVYLLIYINGRGLGPHSRKKNKIFFSYFVYLLIYNNNNNKTKPSFWSYMYFFLSWPYFSFLCFGSAPFFFF